MKLEGSLALNKYFLHLFALETFGDFPEKLKNLREGFDNEGRSYFADALIGAGNRISPEEILRYDRAIKEYAARLSQNRRENINLKYFQYLAVLLAEIFLDNYFHHRKQFLAELNSLVDTLNEEITKPEDKFTRFVEADLKKLAYWMATGSGKTLIMHINYWQFLKYHSERLDNIILVTPNEGLSQQHYKEMQRSGIPCRLYAEHSPSLSLYQNEVLAIDIHKLTGEKRGAGVQVEVDYFAGKNLVFIDEGHKGQATEEKTWKNLREKLGQTGFIFEYSATLGQVIGPKDKDLLEEYSKAILFDYSYKYFYNDGYGKDFYVYNLSEKSFQEKFRDLILTGNLLSFYEQILLFAAHREELREYQIEKPLWAFIGSKVSGAGINSDVLRVVRFLKTIMEDRSLLEENIKTILQGKSGVEDPQGKDIFHNRFEHIRRNGYQISDIYQRLFNSSAGPLCLCELKSAEGEIGLKRGEGEYFGVINIGDVAGFKKLLAASGMEVKPDSFTPSLFEKVNEPGSNINIIIGAKKFIEGWDSWRVCSMGLINIGKGEGPQIIQLFGRGVRLKGRSFSLKRSEEKKYQVKALETLNIFGLNADYINTFLEAIRKEEVEYEEIQLPLKFSEPKKWEKKLSILQTPPDFDFSRQFIKLEIVEDLLRQVKIDLRPRIRFAHGLEVAEAEAEEGRVVLEEKFIDLLNWDKIYLELLHHKIAREYVNLGMDKDILENIIRSNGYELYAFSEQVTPKSFRDLSQLEEIALTVLRSYVDRFYSFRLRQEESRRLKPVPLVRDHENLQYKYYTLKILKDRKEEIKQIKELLKQAEKLYQTDLKELPRIHFDRHLYTPLLVYRKEKDYIKSIPPQLNEGEAEFILRLKDYFKTNQDKLKDEEIFLLRNLSQRGVRFFQTSGFYPDFILWRKKRGKQTIAFIDPKGIRNVEDEKVQLHRYLKELENAINQKGLSLESFILSVSEYQNIKKLYGFSGKSKEELEQEHILFMTKEDKDCIQKLFKRLS